MEEDTKYYVEFEDQSAVANPEQYYGDDFLEYDFGAERSHPVWRRKILKTKSPVPPPQSKATCVKWCYPWPGAKICCGHKLQWRYYWIEVTLEVHLKQPDDIVDKVESCLKTAAILSAIAGIAAAIATGGSAALSAALATFKSAMYVCLTEKIGENLISVEAKSRGYWGDWE